MKSNYELLSKEELIEELENKDKEIAEIKCRIDQIKAESLKEFQEAKGAWEKELRQPKYNPELEGTKIENKQLKDTIIAMAMYTYPGIASFDKTIKSIEENLKSIEENLKIISKSR